MKPRRCKPRHALPEAIAIRMAPADRQALGIETAGEAAERGEIRLERDLQRACEQWLSLHGVRVVHHLSPRAREHVGYPDLTFVVRAGNGLPIPMAVELKTQTGKLTDEQRYVLAGMKADGWTVAVCRSFEEFRRAVNVARYGGDA